jgi:hypothetical protein
MVTHPFIGDLSDKSLDDLTEIIGNLTKQLHFMQRMNKPEMISQLHMALTSYRTEYQRRQAEMWDKKSQTMDKKIDIG